MRALWILIALCGTAAAQVDRYGRPLPAGAVARMGTDLVHEGYARGVAFSRDGTKLVTAGWGEIVVWDAKTMRPLANLGACTNASAVEVFADGKRVMIADAQSVRVLDVATGKELWMYDPPGDAQTGYADLSPDDTSIAVALTVGGDHAVILDARTGGVTIDLRATAKGVAWSPDGKRLAMVGDRSTLAVVDPRTGGVLSSVDTKESSLQAVAWIDAQTLAVGGVGGKVTAWRGKQRVRTFNESGWVAALAASRGRLATLQGGDGGVQVYEVSTGKRVFASPANAQGHQIAFSPDGKRVAFADEGREARRHEPRIVDLATGTLSPSIERHDGNVVSLAFAGGRLHSGSDDATARIWNVADGAPVARIPIAPSDGAMANAAMLAVSPDGTTLAVGARDMTVRLFDAKTAKLLRSFKPTPKQPAWITDLAFTPDGAHLVVAPSSADPIEVRDAKTTALVRKLATDGGGELKRFAITPDGRTLVATVSSSVVVWELATGKRLRTLPSLTSSYMPRVAVSADSTQFATETEGGVAIRTLDGKLVKKLPTKYPVVALAWSPDGKTMAIVTTAETLLVPVAGSAAKTLPVEDVSALAFARDGSLVATGGKDGEIVVWKP